VRSKDPQKKEKGIGPCSRLQREVAIRSYDRDRLGKDRGGGVREGCNMGQGQPLGGKRDGVEACSRREMCDHYRFLKVSLLAGRRRRGMVGRGGCSHKEDKN